MVRRWHGIILTVFLAACASAGQLSQQPVEVKTDGVTGTSSPTGQTDHADEASQPVRSDLEDLGPAPELVNEVWLNTDQPMRLADLRGNVILLDMWTFG